MKLLRIVLLTAVLISSIPAIVTAKEPYRADKGKDTTVIKTYQDKIALEREAIIEDGRRLREAKKTGDKAKIEQVKQETDQDIARRRATILTLYREMGGKTSYRFYDGNKRK